MDIVVVNAVIVSPNLTFQGGITINNGLIESVFEGNKAVEAEKTIDANGCYLTPGFIDLHVHGGGGHDFMDATENAFVEASSTHLTHGTTSLMPTTLAASPDELNNAISVYEKVISNSSGRMLPDFMGLHLEGPYFSLAQCGAQDPNHIRKPVKDDYIKILDSTKHIGRWSAAPELNGGLAFGLELRKRGIIAAIAHSDALHSDAAKALDYGYTLITHFYSGMSTVKRIDAYRYSGLVESGYMFDDFTVEVIADGRHLPVSLLQLIYKIKGANRICLVTDASRASGTELKTAFLGSKNNGTEVIIEDGVAKLKDRSAFAGSVATADRLVRTMYKEAKIPLADVIKMITLTPARICGADAVKGSIAIGKDADLVIFNEDVEINHVIKGGRIVH